MMDYEKTAYKFDLHLADELLKICRSVLNNNQPRFSISPYVGLRCSTWQG